MEQNFYKKTNKNIGKTLHKIQIKVLEKITKNKILKNKKTNWKKYWKNKIKILEKIKIISFGKTIGKIKKVFGRKNTNKSIGTILQKKVLGKKNYKKSIGKKFTKKKCK